ncbi:MAG: winged helix-turn-helix transcriptional regulator [Thermoplasmata archaeon]|nr:winged helix-turn-helix transcriptional regulator [Thermoplasmata archaeon]
MDGFPSSAFKAISDPNRLKIVEMLKGGEVCACKILEEFEFTQPTLSHHMGILIRAGVVSLRKDGKWAYYSLNESVIKSLSDYLRNLL